MKINFEHLRATLSIILNYNSIGIRNVNHYDLEYYLFFEILLRNVTI